MRNKKIQEFMKEKKMSNLTMLENYYYNRLQGIVSELANNDTTRKMIFWQEVFQKNNSRKEAIIHIWKSSNEAQRVFDLGNITAAGHAVILSSCWWVQFFIFFIIFLIILSANIL